MAYQVRASQHFFSCWKSAAANQFEARAIPSLAPAIYEESGVLMGVLRGLPACVSCSAVCCRALPKAVGSDKLVGTGLLLASVTIFVYYTLWVIVLVSERFFFSPFPLPLLTVCRVLLPLPLPCHCPRPCPREQNGHSAS